MVENTNNNKHRFKVFNRDEQPTALLSYVLGFITGIIFFVIENKANSLSSMRCSVWHLRP